MAIFNEILVGRFNRFAQKLFAIKASPPLRQLSGELMPVLEMDRLSVELRWLAQITSWAFAVQVGQSAGNLSALRLRNPVGSGVIATIEKAHASTLAGFTPVFQLNSQITSVDLTTPAIAIPRDTRSGAQTASVCIPSFGNPAATAGGLMDIWPNTSGAQQPIDLILTEDQELVLTPGGSYTLYETVVNETANFTFWWRERPLEESERQ